MPSKSRGGLVATPPLCRHLREHACWRTAVPGRGRTPPAAAVCERACSQPMDAKGGSLEPRRRRGRCVTAGPAAAGVGVDVGGSGSEAADSTCSYFARVKLGGGHRYLDEYSSSDFFSDPLWVFPGSVLGRPPGQGVPRGGTPGAQGYRDGAGLGQRVRVCALGGGGGGAKGMQRTTPTAEIGCSRT